MQQVTVRVPASTSNLGPGFDCLGVALCIYSHLTFSRGRKSRMPRIVTGAARRFFNEIGRHAFTFSFSCATEIPAAQRGPIVAAYVAEHGKKYGGFVAKEFELMPDPADHPVFLLIETR